MGLFSTVWDIIVFLLALTLIVSIHELGHFLLAKKANVLIHEFSIGMGPSIIKKKKGEIIYALRAIPLGGYVSMGGEDRVVSSINKGMQVCLDVNEIGLVKEIILDSSIKKCTINGRVHNFDLYGDVNKDLFIELVDPLGVITKYEVARDAKYIYGEKNEVQITTHDRSFEGKTIWQRFLILFCGPLFNFILAFLLIFMVSLIQGKPSEKNIVNQSTNVSLISGDIIKVVGDTEVENIHDFRKALESITSNKANVTVVRNGIEENLEVYLSVIMQNIGIANDTSENNKDVLSVGGLGLKASEAGIKLGDVITSINGTNVTTWDEVIGIAKNYNENQIKIGVIRNGVNHVYNFDVLSDDTLATIGASRVIIRMGFDTGYEFDLLYPLYYPFVYFKEAVVQMIGTIGLLFNPNSGVGVKELSGPVGIFQLVSNAASQGIFALMVFIAFLSVNIGLMNLLPIPALDGGRLVFLFIEAITKKKLSPKVEYWINNISFFLLLGLMLFVTFGDIGRLFR